MLPNPNFRSPHGRGVVMGKEGIDLQSVMLYDSYQFSSNGEPTLMGNDESRHFKGEWPTQSDVFGVKTLYQDAEVDGKRAPKLPNTYANGFLEMWRNYQARKWCREGASS